MKFLKNVLSEATIKELNEKLGADLLKQVDEKIGDYPIDLGKEKLIPHSVFDEERKTLKNQIADRDNQLKELGEKAKGNADFELQIKNLQEQNKANQEKYEAQLKTAKQNFGLKEAIASYKPRNLTALEALIDKSKLTYTDDGKVTAGLKEQIDALKTSDSYLFEVVQSSGSGNPQNGGFGFDTGKSSEAEQISKIFNS